MKQAFIIEDQAQAVCVWEGPDQASVEAVFAKAGVKIDSIDSVTEYGGGPNPVKISL